MSKSPPDRKDAVLQALYAGYRTSEEIAHHLNLAEFKTLLALWDLEKDGKVERISNKKSIQYLPKRTSAPD